MKYLQQTKQKNKKNNLKNTKTQKIFKLKINKTFKKVLYNFLSIIIISSLTYIAIQYSNGKRLSKQQDSLFKETGLLNANSFPTGAKVYVNGELVTATDDSINLDPGTYEVKISKTGFSEWVKNLKIEKGLVTQTNARLYPIAPSINALTVSGAQLLLPSPDGKKFLYYTASESTTEKNGVYILELTGSNLNPLQKESRQLLSNSTKDEFKDIDVIWSPDSQEIIFSKGNEIYLISDIHKKYKLKDLVSIGFKKPVLNKKKNLDADTDDKNLDKKTTQEEKENQENSLINKYEQTNFVIASQEMFLQEWEKEIYIREVQYLKKFPEVIQQIATQSAVNVYFSPDKKKLLYTALKPITLKEHLKEPLPAINSQPQDRTLEPGFIYIYDNSEDTNFKIAKDPSCTIEQDKLVCKNAKKLLSSFYQYNSDEPVDKFSSFLKPTFKQTAKAFENYHTSLYINTYQWMPDSQHILYIDKDNKQIKIKEYDNTNDTVIYNGPFYENFVYPWSDGNKLIILTTFNENMPKNIYSIELK